MISSSRGDRPTQYQRPGQKRTRARTADVGTRDGHLDLAVANNGDKTVAVLPNGCDATPTHQPACTGDCDGNGTVDVAEIITMVNMALGNTPLSACMEGDADGKGAIEINEILTAVNNALKGCMAVPGTPTPTATPSPTPTLSLTSAIAACDNDCQAALRVCGDERFFGEYDSVSSCTNECVAIVEDFASDVGNSSACVDAQVQYIQCCTARGRCGGIPGCDPEFVSATNACGGSFGGCPLIFF